MPDGGPDERYSAGRVARYAGLTMLRAQRDHPLPQPVADLIWARKLLPVVTRAEVAPNPFGTEAPVRGAGDMTITYAVCPPGTGPSLHSHRRTFETFTVLQGRFRFFLGDDSDAHAEAVDLERFDVVSVPPGIDRAFKNIGTEEGVLQVIITGGIHDANDITFPASTTSRIAAIDRSALAWLRATGLQLPGE